MNSKKIIIGISILTITSLGIYFKVINNNMVHSQENNQINISSTANTTKNKIKNSIDKNIVLTLTTDLDLAYDFSDNKIRKEHAKYAVLAKVKSIDGCTNYNKTQKEYTAVMTYGNIEVLSVLKGEIKDKTIPFIKLGGEISFEEYEKGLEDSQKEKLDLTSKLTVTEKKTSYVSYYPNEDVKLEEGKIYLMYLNYNSDYDKYVCEFLQYGTREVEPSTIQLKKSINSETRVENLNNVKVKNNETGKFESLVDVF